MSTLCDREMLDGIRRRFVGSGEEHDLLARLSGSYHDAYNRGAKDRETELLQQASYDANAIAFARALSEMNRSVRDFLCPYEVYGFGVAETAAWLKSIGKTPAMLRELADAMEKDGLAAGGG